MFNSDAESASQRAGLKMRTGLESVMKPQLPNLLIVNWDYAHGSRRITSRGWHADPFLRETFEKFVTERKSIVQLIQNSAEFRTWFVAQKQRLQQRVGKRVQNFSFAGHRFDSTSKPVGRTVINAIPVIYVI